MRTSEHIRKAYEAKMREPSFTATPKQEVFAEAVFSGKYLYLALGGGIRGTKTWGTLAIIFLLCRIYPGSRWAVVRKDLPTLRRNTLPSIAKLRMTAAGFVGDINQSTWSYLCSNGSEILLFPESFQTDPDLDRWKGLEVNGFLLEEANEMAEASANKAIERAGSWIIPATPMNPHPKQPPPFVFFTFNPCANWPRTWFYEPSENGTLEPPFFYLPSTAADNPYIPDEVREAWKNLPPAEYERFIMGSWEFTDDPDQLFKAEWILAARALDPVMGPARLGVDPARFGDDETTFCRTSGNTWVSMDSYPQLKLDRCADIAMAMAQDRLDPINGEDIRIDTVGLGGGVADIMTTRGWDIMEVVAGAKPWKRRETFYKFKNHRSQMWWEGAEKFRQGLCPLPDEVPTRLFADLTAAHYSISADRMVEIEPKDQMKKRIGRSPDWADAYLMAIMDPPELGRPQKVQFQNVRM